MKLIVGLGNPGDKYKDTFHNVGFSALDKLAAELGENQWSNRFKGQMIRGNYGKFPYILLKPMTYMNISGESVVACMQYYKVSLENTLVISDDIDRPVGLLRYRASGGHGGHNGLRSIIQLCGQNTFHRLKVGIGRPDFKQEVSSYVLSKPRLEANQLIESALNQATGYLLDYIQGITIQIKQQVD